MRRTWFAVLLSSCLFAACNAVLGIEEGELRKDGGAGEAGAPPPLECAFVFTGHRTIADLSSKSGAERTYSEQLLAETIPGALVRVAAYHKGAGLPFDLFSVETKDNGSTSTTPVSDKETTPLDMHRIDATSIGILVAIPQLANPANADLALLRVADSDGAMPKPAPTPLGSLGMADQVSGLFLAEAGGEVAYAASYHSSPAQFDLVYGRGASTPTKLGSSPVPVGVEPGALIRMGNALHLFFGHPGGPAGSSQVTIVDTMTAAPPRSLGPPQSYFLTGGTNSLGKFNVAFVTAGTSIALYTGQIDIAQISSFTAADVPLARQFAGLADVPYTGRPRWFEDTLIVAGPTSAAGNELTVVWGDVQGGIRVQQKMLTAQRGGKVRTAALAQEQQLGPLGGFIDLFWIEIYQDDAGQAYDVLYYDQVRCLGGGSKGPL